MGSTKIFGVLQVVGLDFGDSPLGRFDHKTGVSGGINVPDKFDTSHFLNVSSSPTILKDRVGFIRELSVFFSQFSFALGNLFGSCIPDAYGKYYDELILYHLKNAHVIFSPFRIDGVSGLDVISNRCLLHWRKLSLRDLIMVGTGLYKIHLDLFEWQYKQDYMSLKSFHDHIFDAWINFFCNYLKTIEDSKSKREDWSFIYKEVPFSSLGILLSLVRYHATKNDKLVDIFNGIYQLVLLVSIEIVKNNISFFIEEYQKEASNSHYKDIVAKIDSNIRNICEDIFHHKNDHDTVSALLFFYVFTCLPIELKENFFEFVPIAALAKLMFLAKNDTSHTSSYNDLILEKFISDVNSGEYPKFIFYCDDKFWIRLSREIKLLNFKGHIEYKEKRLVDELIEYCNNGFSSIIDSTFLSVDMHFIRTLSILYYYHVVLSNFNIIDEVTQKTAHILYQIDFLSAETKFSPLIGLSDIQLLKNICKVIGLDFLLGVLNKETKSRTNLVNDLSFHRKAYALFERFSFSFSSNFDSSTIQGLDAGSAINRFDSIFHYIFGPNASDNFIRKVFLLLFLERFNLDSRRDIVKGIDFSKLIIKKVFLSMKDFSHDLENFFVAMIMLCDDLLAYGLSADVSSFWKYFSKVLLDTSNSITGDAELFFYEMIQRMDLCVSELKLFFRENGDTELFKSCINNIGTFCKIKDDINSYSSSTGYKIPVEIVNKINHMLSHRFVINPTFLSTMPLHLLMEMNLMSRKGGLEVLEEKFLEAILARQKSVFDGITVTLDDLLLSLSRNNSSDFVGFSVIAAEEIKKSYSFFILVNKTLHSGESSSFQLFINNLLSNNISSKKEGLLRQAIQNFYGDNISLLRSLMKKVYLDTAEDKRGSAALQKIYFLFSVFWKILDDIFSRNNIIPDVSKSKEQVLYDSVTRDHVQIFNDFFDFNLAKHCKHFLSKYRNEMERKKRDIC
ncbi:hypothetical protein [Candidatus Ichthyocystis sparus]|nr:hypothetical protein [Candidatus Ichthyocystis sparus]